MQTNTPQLEQFDLIIDDGTHLAGHIAQTYRTHWPSFEARRFSTSLKTWPAPMTGPISIAALALYPRIDLE